MRCAGNPLRSFFLIEGWLPARFSDAGSRLIVRNRTSRGGADRIYFCNLTCDFFQSLLRFFSPAAFSSFLVTESEAFGLPFSVEKAQLVHIRKNANSTLN
jgi:hypothetical protein